MNGVVEVERLTKRFGDLVAVDAVSFAVAEREFFTLLGSSGCGKTTTLRCVAGLETADGGRIAIGGETVFDAGAGLDVGSERRAIGMVFQSYAVWPHMSVFDNIAYPLRIRRQPREAIRRRVDEVLAILDMATLGRRMPSQLSGGQQQRVALGRALAMNPKVLLLDEPLSNLDAKLRESMRAELKQIQKETGLPILYVTHDQVEALAMSDRIAVMAHGVIHQLAPPDAIYRRPATRFVLDFVGAVNYLPCRVTGEANGRLALALADGETLDLPMPPHRPAGDSLELAVRPEDVELHPAGDGRPAGRVLLQSFIGTGFDYRVALGAATLRVQTGKDAVFAEGAPVGIVVREGLLLDATTRDDDARIVT